MPFLGPFIELFLFKISLVLCLKEDKVRGKGKIVSLSQWPRGHWDCGFESRRGHGYLSCECCVLFMQRSLRRADHSSRGALPGVVCISVIVKPRQWVVSGPLRAVAL